LKSFNKFQLESFISILYLYVFHQTFKLSRFSIEISHFISDIVFIVDVVSKFILLISSFKINFIFDSQVSESLDFSLKELYHSKLLNFAVLFQSSKDTESPDIEASKSYNSHEFKLPNLSYIDTI